MQFNNNTFETVNTQGSLYIKKFICIPTGNYRTPYQRAYNLNPNPDNLQTLSAVVQSNPNGKVTQTDIASTLSSMVSLDVASAIGANIPNGWGIKRLLFFMEVEVNKGTYTEVVYLQGYSEYYDPALTIKVDPNMKFYINSILIVSKMFDQNTGQITVMPRETYNVLRGENDQMMDIIDSNMDEKVAIRPTDLLTNISVMDTWGNGDTNFNNHLGSLDVTKAVTSNRNNNNPVDYYSKIINSTIEASNIASTSIADGDMSQLMLQASQLVSEPNMLTNPFIVALHQITGELLPTDFTINILERINPIQIDFVETNMDTAINLNPVFGSEDSEDLFTPTIENTTATVAVQALAGYMSDEFIVELVVAVNNTQGVNVVTILNMRSFIEGIDLVSFANRLTSKIEHVLMRDLTKNNQIFIDAMIHVDLIGDSNVQISINGAPHVRFKYPMFADSLFTPVKTTKGKRDAMAEEVSMITDYVL